MTIAAAAITLPPRLGTRSHARALFSRTPGSAQALALGAAECALISAEAAIEIARQAERRGARIVLVNARDQVSTRIHSAARAAGVAVIERTVDAESLLRA